MGHIRAFTQADIPMIARLWLRIFRKVEQEPSRALLAFFHEVFFNSPWQADGIHSLVYEQEGELVGFLGVVARQMLFKERPIRVAVATQLMMDNSKPRGLAAAALPRELFSGPQDLTYSDGAIDIARRLWVRAGGEEALLYCLEWTRLLRPIQYRVGQSQSAGRAAKLARALRPLWQIADTGYAVLPGNPYRLRSELRAEMVDAAQFIEALRQLSCPDSLRPDWSGDGAAWVLGLAAQAQRYGQLFRGLVRDKDGSLLGCYAVYFKKGGVAQVLLVHARPGTLVRVLEQLCQQADRAGCVAVNGMVMPRGLLDLGQARCNLVCRDIGVLFHSRDPEIAAAIHRGDAAISRFDGEWFLRLGIDRMLDW